MGLIHISDYLNPITYEQACLKELNQFINQVERNRALMLKNKDLDQFRQAYNDGQQNTQ